MKMCLKSSKSIPWEAADTPRCEEVEVRELNKADDVVLAGSFERLGGVDSLSGYESLCERDVFGCRKYTSETFLKQ